MQETAPALSLILCSRNDQYMGNSRWRLETALNYAGRKVHSLGREKQVEIVLADWGSEVRLNEVVQLTPEAASLVRFVYIPTRMARDLQRDSPFPEVLALNAAARRANGSFIGRIDQDTLVGERFLKFFFDLIEGKHTVEWSLDKTPLFCNQRMVPYRFTSQSPALSSVDRLIVSFGKRLTMEYRNPRAPFYSAGVGIWLLHRNLWYDCEGYDERMIYMNGMETNMVRRLQLKYKLVNLGLLVDYDFYHLEHYHPHTLRRSSTHRKVNSRYPFSEPEELRPNGDSWGLAEYPLEIQRCENTKPNEQPLDRLAHVGSLLKTVVQLAFDWIRSNYLLWRGRSVHIGQLLLSDSPLRWPHLLKGRWEQRKLARTSQPFK